MQPANGHTQIVPLTPETWGLFEDLLGPDGLQGGCWCAYFRVRARDFDQQSPAEHKLLARQIVDDHRPFGLLALQEGTPVGWVAVSPRADNLRLQRSEVARVEEGTDVGGTWSVTCFYIDRRARHTGLSATLLDGAVGYAGTHDATTVEGYPVDASDRKVGAPGLYHGELQTFLEQGFTLVARRGTRRALVRKTL